MKSSRKGIRFGKYWRAGVAFAAVSALAAVLAVGGTGSDETGDRMVAGWGGEATAALAQHASALSPIGLVNACGLGASSCFKCHNGKRAEAPKTDAATAPWHAQHAKVNNSCVGCHSGNPRMMKQDMAHKNLLAKPLGSAEACGGCHKADLAKVQGVYQAISGGK
ncbi:MAG: hypothetical protein BGO61_01010 [Thiobacillus sp. 65-69]|nr:hypothetical protein [Thiobacillus sp.]ODU88046.1 MAG: hypothetical protein ABT21_11655 [Thiobacillus sp. SCN 65-179]OJW36294.1 MAG: hypothetical protein BGO61_01010 [Thiobacillus sp. 65-69]